MPAPFQYYTPLPNVPLNWDTLARRISIARSQFRETPEATRTAVDHMINDCFARRNQMLPPSQEQLRSIAEALRDSASFETFAQNLDVCSQRTFGLFANAFTRFRQSGAFATLMAQLTTGPQEVNELINLLRSSRAPMDYKNAELTRILKDNAATESQLRQIYNAVRENRLLITFTQLLKQEVKLGKLNANILADLITDPAVENDIARLVSSGKDFKDAQLIDYISRRNGGYGDDVIDAIKVGNKLGTHRNFWQIPARTVVDTVDWFKDEGAKWRVGDSLFKQAKNFFIGVRP
jgi:hypothetical protein